MRILRLLPRHILALALAAMLALVPLAAQSAPRSHPGNTGKVLVGGEGSSHKGGHYVIPSNVPGQPQALDRAQGQQQGRQQAPSYGSDNALRPPTVYDDDPPAAKPEPRRRAQPSTGSGQAQNGRARGSPSVRPRPGKAAQARPRGAPRAGKASGARDKHGRLLRSEKAKQDFKALSGFPHGRPGYVIDHRVPLACGGADTPSNMQWQSIAEAKAKDRVERVGCGR